MEAIDSKEVVAAPTMQTAKPRFLHIQWQIVTSVPGEGSSGTPPDHMDMFFPDTRDMDGKIRARIGEALTKWMEAESDRLAEANERARRERAVARSGDGSAGSSQGPASESTGS